MEICLFVLAWNVRYLDWSVRAGLSTMQSMRRIWPPISRGPPYFRWYFINMKLGLYEMIRLWVVLRILCALQMKFDWLIRTDSICSIHDTYSFITNAALQIYIHSHNIIRPSQQKLENIYAGPMEHLLSLKNNDGDPSQSSGNVINGSALFAEIQVLCNVTPDRNLSGPPINILRHIFMQSFE